MELDEGEKSKDTERDQTGVWKGEVDSGEYYEFSLSFTSINSIHRFQHIKQATEKTFRRKTFL